MGALSTKSEGAMSTRQDDALTASYREVTSQNLQDIRAQNAILNQMYQELALRSPDGTISQATFSRLFDMPGLLGERLFALFDTGKDGAIQLGEFIKGYSRFLACRTVEDRMNLLFQLFDLGDQDRITREELRTILLSLITPPNYRLQNPPRHKGMHLDPDDVKAHVDSLDDMKDTSVANLADSSTPNLVLSTDSPEEDLISVVEHLVEKAFRQCDTNASGFLEADEFRAWIKQNKGVSELIESFFIQMAWNLPNSMTKRNSGSSATTADDSSSRLSGLPVRKQLVIKKHEETKWKCENCTVTCYTSREEFENDCKGENGDFIALNHVILQPAERILIRFCPHCGHPLIALKSTIPTLELQETPAAEVPDYYREGELLYSGGMLGIQKPKLCRVVLYNKFLYRYKISVRDDPRQVVFINGYFVKVKQSEHLPNLFSIKLSPPKGSTAKSVEFFHSSEMYARQWGAALEQAAQTVALSTYYELDETIGKGKFGTIYKAFEKATRRRVAVKEISKKRIDEKQKELIRVEISILQLVQHPYIANMEQVFETQNHIYLVMELFEGGDLWSWMKHNAPHGLDEDRTRRIIFAVLQAIRYLHAIGIAHRDLKLENLLLRSPDDPTQIVVTDFGLSKFVGPNERMEAACGTITYVAPEVLRLQGYTKSVDLWSTGVMAYLVLRARFPFDDKTQNQIITRILHQPVQLSDSKWKKISEEARDLIRRLLEKDPDTRITVEDALDHEWFADLRRKDVEEEQEPVMLADLPRNRSESRRKVGKFARTFSVENLLAASLSFHEPHPPHPVSTDITRSTSAPNPTRE